MKYKRLTNNNYNPEYDFCCDCKYYGEPNGCNRWNGECANYKRFIEIYNRLAELEDKIENGTLVELPCKVWDTFYCVRLDGIREAQVVEIVTADGKSWGVYDNIGEWYNLNEIYFTKAEAEKRLKELQYEDFCAMALGYDEFHLPQKN